MDDLRRNRRETLGTLLAAFFLCLAGNGVVHAAGSLPESKNVTVSLGTTIPGRPGKPPSADQVAHRAKPVTCHMGERNTEYGRRISDTKTGTDDQPISEALLPVRCVNGVWELGWVCVGGNCPVGTVREELPPQPAFAEVQQAIIAQALIPEPAYAPPIERGGAIAAVVGKRFYFTINPASFRPVRFNEIYANSYTAEALLTPIRIGLQSNIGNMSCDAPINNITTRSARNFADSVDCYIIITNRPETGTATGTVFITWDIDVRSNIAEWNQTFQAESSTSIEIPIKELQAVVTW
jgi:hypothetical protein